MLSDKKNLLKTSKGVYYGYSDAYIFFCMAEIDGIIGKESKMEGYDELLNVIRKVEIDEIKFDSYICCWCDNWILDSFNRGSCKLKIKNPKGTKPNIVLNGVFQNRVNYNYCKEYKERRLK